MTVMSLMEKVDKIIIGGGMAFTFLKSKGYRVGRSLVEGDMLDLASQIIDKARSRGIPFYLPVDCVVAEAREEKVKTMVVPAQEIPDEDMGLDIGPATITLFEEVVSGAGTIVWNGPMGVFELSPFSRGTFSMVDSLARSQALTILGGGDTDVCVELLKERLLPHVNLFCYGQVASPYGSGAFINDLRKAFEADERMVLSEINGREAIYQSIKDFLGKGK